MSVELRSAPLSPQRARGAICKCFCNRACYSLDILFTTLTYRRQPLSVTGITTSKIRNHDATEAYPAPITPEISRNIHVNEMFVNAAIPVMQDNIQVRPVL